MFIDCERSLLNAKDIFKSNNCRTDYLEIRDGYWHKSPILGRYCGSGRIQELIKSSSSRMLLTLVTTHRQVGLRGFAASYEGIRSYCFANTICHQAFICFFLFSFQILSCFCIYAMQQLFAVGI